MRNLLEKFLPSRLLWRLTVVNTVVMILLMTLIGWGVYETACSLSAGMGNFEEHRQQQFNATLLQYVVIFIVIGLIVGIALHIYFTRKIIDPIKQLIESTKQIKRGKYPARLSTTAEGELIDLVEQFNEMVEQLEKNEYERDKLVTDLSHEIRTPLSNVSGYLQALKAGVVEGNQQLYESLLKETSRIEGMIQQLDELKLWNYTKDHVKKKEKFQLKPIINQVVSMFSWQLQKRDIPLKVEVEETTFFGDAEGMEQALNNILINAIEYYKGSAEIVIQGERFHHKYILTISGPGEEISKDQSKYIFDRFYRVDSSRSRDTGGSGLGLAITKEIIHYHEGDISFESKNGRNMVTLTLPIKEEVDHH